MTKGGEEKPKKGETKRFDKESADATDDQKDKRTKRHDNPKHPGLLSHLRRILTAEDTRDDLEDDE